MRDDPVVDTFDNHVQAPCESLFHLYCVCFAQKLHQLRDGSRQERSKDSCVKTDSLVGLSSMVGS